MLREREKLAALGKLSAGLAHELNNPAAAVRRAADHLATALVTQDARALRLGALALSAEQIAVLETARRSVNTSSRVLDPSRAATAKTSWPSSSRTVESPTHGISLRAWSMLDSTSPQSKRWPRYFHPRPSRMESAGSPVA